MVEHCVIIGGGHGGAQLCMSLRQNGYEGEITLVSSDDGLPYHRPPLSKAFLKTPSVGRQIIKSQAFYDDNKIDLKLGKTVTDIDRAAHRIELNDGQKIDYTKLVLSTGTKARKLSIPGAEASGIHYLKIAEDAELLRDELAEANSVSVIGGGFIGLEAAATFVGLGKKVTVFEAGARLLGRAVSPEISEYFLQKHQNAGMDIKFGVSITSFSTSDGRVAGVNCDGEKISSDLVLVGIGVVANCALAEQAGLVCNNGIVVDAHMQTSDKDVLAIGDCVIFEHWQTGNLVRLESVQNANDQARNAALTLTGNQQRYQEVPWFWSDQGNDKLQIVGLSIGSDQRIVCRQDGEDKISVFHYKGSKLMAIDTVNNPSDHMIGRRLLAGLRTPLPTEVATVGFSLREFFKSVQ